MLYFDIGVKAKVFKGLLRFAKFKHKFMTCKSKGLRKGMEFYKFSSYDYDNY